jgi:hypothetical protein
MTAFWLIMLTIIVCGAVPTLMIYLTTISDSGMAVINRTEQNFFGNKSVLRPSPSPSETSNKSKSTENGTGDDIKTTTAIFAVIVAATSAVVGYLTYRYQKNMAMATYRYQEKQYKLNALIQILNLLSSEKHISARESVRRVYEDYLLESDQRIKDLLFLQKPVTNDVELVKADFDQVGALVKNELIDKYTILDTYGLTIVESWRYLEHHIKYVAKNNSKYMSNFKYIADEASIYLSRK